MSPSTIQKGFLFAGLSNVLAVPLFSKLFTNHSLMDAQPGVMGLFGLIAIMLWGLAYIAVRKKYAMVPWLVAVFVVEKLAYVVVWLLWHSNNSLSSLYEQDSFAGIFYAIYGANDFLFMVFFGLVFWKVRAVE